MRKEKAALHAFQTAVGEDLQLKCAERSSRTLEMAVETVEIQERYTKKAVWALKQEESELALYLKVMGEKLEALMGEIKDDRGTQPIHIEQDEVVAMAECVLARPGASPGNDRDDRDEVNGLVERAAPHLTDEECQQLRAAMAARKHLFAKGKGDLGRTDIVQHQIHTGNQPAIKQGVRRYPAARREEERQLVEDMLAIGIIQESNSAWSSPTVLVKKKDGTTRFCIDYVRLN